MLTYIRNIINLFKMTAVHNIKHFYRDSLPFRRDVDIKIPHEPNEQFIIKTPNNMLSAFVTDYTAILLYT